MNSSVIQNGISTYYKCIIPLTPKDSWKRAWRERRRDFIIDENNLKDNLERFRERYETEGLDPLAFKKFKNDYIRCFLLFCLSADEYFQYDFMNKGWSWRNHHVTIERRHFIDSLLNNRAERGVLSNKVKFNRTFRPYINRKWCYINKVPEEKFLSKFTGVDRLIIKPRARYGGIGIEAYDIKGNPENKLKAIYKEYFEREGNYIAEEYLNQDGILHDINPSSLNSIRVTTLMGRSGPEVIDGFFRCGCGDAVVDNFSSGGIIFPVDIRNGILYEGHSATELKISVHPLSHIQVKGLRLPKWKDICRAVCDAHRLCPEGIYLVGWDVAICKGKVTLIEGNSTPGYTSLYDPHNNLWKKFKDIFPLREAYLAECRSAQQDTK